MQNVTWWNAFYLCPAYPPTRDYTRKLVRKIIGEWGYEGLKLDGQHMQAAAAEGYERVVYLGSHIFQGLAREAGLKLLELTNGALVTMFDSPLGFRHERRSSIYRHHLARR